MATATDEERQIRIEAKLDQLLAIVRRILRHPIVSRLVGPISEE